MKVLSAGNRKIVATDEKQNLPTVTCSSFSKFSFHRHWDLYTYLVSVSVGQVGAGATGLKGKITEEVGIEKTVSMDLIVSVGEEEVSVAQLLVPRPLLWKKEGPSCQGGPCTFFQALILRPLKQCLSPNPSYFHLCTFPFSNGLHLHIYITLAERS